MVVHLPTDGELECDECGDYADVDLTTYAGDPETVGVDNDDLPEGWTHEDGCHYCPGCSRNR